MAAGDTLLLCLDTGHFHPTETIADRLSAVLAYLDGALLHLSRGVRWDDAYIHPGPDPHGRGDQRPQHVRRSRARQAAGAGAGCRVCADF